MTIPHNTATNQSGPDMNDNIERIVCWNLDAGNTGDRYNARQAAMYTGLQCEELAEKLETIGLQFLAEGLNTLANEFKRGGYDSYFRGLENIEQTSLLDADMDLLVVSVGAAMSLGADPVAALREVVSSNDSKRNPDGTLSMDANGKIVKGRHYRAPELAPFLPPEVSHD